MFRLASEQDTRALGAALATRARRGDVIALSGPLGAGKTTLARGFIQKMSESDEEIVSPTFTLVQIYETPGAPIWHFDLYRLNKPEDALELGFEEALVTAISLVEWPERLGEFLPASRLEVTLSIAGDGRQARLSGGPEWTERMAAVREHVSGT
ncbi:MAG: tRNA (adenosine(37)-N6)-threonylcarbamoyltransferase complex ATPase subunit type 1 TsaE [Rhodospirillaceae bacterium]|nr:tRNA (adenosine(37)-N6)-threonylcarbamoyltransferase complex ATPase subunit type 1 TsaE [Rhodospirillaceae bacterium]